MVFLMVEILSHSRRWVRLAAMLVLGFAFWPQARGGVFTNAASLNTARYLHSATLLPDGRVLVAGGVLQGPAGQSTSAEIYNPASGIWSPTGPLNATHLGDPALLLPDGKVLVAGANAE